MLDEVFSYFEDGIVAVKAKVDVLWIGRIVPFEMSLQAQLVLKSADTSVALVRFGQVYAILPLWKIPEKLLLSIQTLGGFFQRPIFQKLVLLFHQLLLKLVPERAILGHH